MRDLEAEVRWRQEALDKANELIAGLLTSIDKWADLAHRKDTEIMELRRKIK